MYSKIFSLSTVFHLKVYFMYVETIDSMASLYLNITKIPISFVYIIYIYIIIIITSCHQHGYR